MLVLTLAFLLHVLCRTLHVLRLDHRYCVLRVPLPPRLDLWFGLDGWRGAVTAAGSRVAGGWFRFFLPPPPQVQLITPDIRCLYTLLPLWTTRTPVRCYVRQRCRSTLHHVLINTAHSHKRYTRCYSTGPYGCTFHATVGCSVPAPAPLDMLRTPTLRFARLTARFTPAAFQRIYAMPLTVCSHTAVLRTARFHALPAARRYAAVTLQRVV